MLTNEKLAELLAPYWRRACARCTGSKSADWFAKITTTMAVPPTEPLPPAGVMVRAYHNMQHVHELCELYETKIRPVYATLDLRPRDDVVFLTCFFHDIVYDATKKDNEELSAAALAEFAADTALPDSVRDPVFRITMATKKHTEWTPQQVPTALAAGASSVELERPIAQEVLDTQVFLDMDLAILGASPSRYEEYSSQIAIEYRHFPPLDFCAGRGAFLQGMVAKEGGAATLFHTDVVRELRAKQADANLAWESDALKKRLAVLLSAEQKQ